MTIIEIVNHMLIIKAYSIYCSHKVGDIRTFKFVAPTKSIKYI